MRTAWAARRVLQRVNAEPKSAGVKRVLWLLRALREAETIRLRLYEASDQAPYDDVRESFADPQLQALNLEFQKLIEQIEHGLKRYRWTPTIRCLEFMGLQQAYVWPKKSESDQWENLAVEYLIGHAQGGTGRSPAPILLFRQCRRCRKWFYAITEHQTSCSVRCRKQFHSESPEAHSKRAKYMRDYRRDQKELDRRALERNRLPSQQDRKKGKQS